VFLEIRDPDIDRLVGARIASGLLWPHPLIQMNPRFEQAAWVDGSDR
jgi:hypothetical protein